MDRISKFLGRLTEKSAMQVIAVVRRIEQGDIAGLDIKSLVGMQGYFRCRIGDIRIIFQKNIDRNQVVDLDFRGNVYRRLKR